MIISGIASRGYFKKLREAFKDTFRELNKKTESKFKFLRTPSDKRIKMVFGFFPSIVISKPEEASYL